MPYLVRVASSLVANTDTPTCYCMILTNHHATPRYAWDAPTLRPGLPLRWAPDGGVLRVRGAVGDGGLTALADARPGAGHGGGGSGSLLLTETPIFPPTSNPTTDRSTRKCNNVNTCISGLV